MSPDEIAALIRLLEEWAKLIRQTHADYNDPASVDRRAILEVWLESTAERLKMAPDLPPLQTFEDMHRGLQLRLAKYNKEGI